MHRPLKHVAGSLLLIVLPEVQRLVESAGADCMTRIGEVVELFSKTAISLIKENQGVMQLIIGDQCLATWNVLQRSSMHVTNAITTAISIRDSWARVSMQVSGEDRVYPENCTYCIQPCPKPRKCVSHVYPNLHLCRMCITTFPSFLVLRAQMAT